MRSPFLPALFFSEKGCMQEQWVESGDYHMNRPGIVNLIKEPLLHFLLIGAALFLLFGWRGNPAPLPGGQPGSPSAVKLVQ